MNESEWSKELGDFFKGGRHYGMFLDFETMQWIEYRDEPGKPTYFHVLRGDEDGDAVVAPVDEEGVELLAPLHGDAVGDLDRETDRQ